MNNSTFEKPSEMVDALFYVSMIVINAFSGVFATILNLLVIVTFVKTPSLRTPYNILILSLAIADFGVGALVQPAYCTWLYSIITNNTTALFYSTFVLLSGDMILLGTTSLLTITAITVDRFLALHFSLRYQELVTKKRISIVAIVIWTFSVLLTCLLSIIFSLSEKMMVIWLIEDFLFFSLFFVNITLMLKISSIINRHAAQIQVQQQAMDAQPGAAGNIKRSVNIMYYILGTFFLCHFPWICFNFIDYFSTMSKMDSEIAWWVLREVLLTILYMNSSINPIIYFWRIQDMRNAALQLLPFIRRINNNINVDNNNRNAENDVYAL